MPCYDEGVSPTVFRWKGYRFFFFSREEERMHVHVYCAEGEAKFWIEPKIALARNHHLSAKRLAELENVVRDRKSDIVNAWHGHFPG